MAVTRRDGGVVTLPSCLQVARHQLAFPFPSRLRPSRCFLNDRILSFSMEIILSRVCVNTANSSNLGTKACSSIHYTQFFKMISIRYGWLDVYIYIWYCSTTRVVPLAWAAQDGCAFHFLRISIRTHDPRQTSWNFYDCSSAGDIRSRNTWDRGLKYLQQVAWQLNT